MKTLLKLFAIAGMSIAVTTAANAIELTCSKPTIYVGQQSKNANDTVVQVDVRHTSAGWQVHHRLGGGLIASRSTVTTRTATSVPISASLFIEARQRSNQCHQWQRCDAQRKRRATHGDHDARHRGKYNSYYR